MRKGILILSSILFTGQKDLVHVLDMFFLIDSSLCMSLSQLILSTWRLPVFAGNNLLYNDNSRHPTLLLHVKTENILTNIF